MERYQELFNHLSEEHGLILLESEMTEIALICERTLLNNSSGSDEAKTVKQNEQKQEFDFRCYKKSSSTGRCDCLEEEKCEWYRNQTG